MVEETEETTNKSNKVRRLFLFLLTFKKFPSIQPRARPRPVFMWTVLDVQKWFRRHCSDFQPSVSGGATSETFPVEEYVKLFADNDITGRTLLRMTDDSLYRMGIHNNEHRNAIYFEVLKQKLKEDILTIRDLELKYRVYSNS